MKTLKVNSTIWGKFPSGSNGCLTLLKQTLLKHAYSVSEDLVLGAYIRRSQLKGTA